MVDSKLATFKCDPELWEQFKAKAKQDKTNASALLKDFIKAYLAGRIDLSMGSEDIDTKLQAIEAKYAELNERLGKLSVA